MKFNAIYYVKGGKLGYWVYAHYPITEPDTPYMLFKFKENAEMFCGALNAENECREADPVKHARWERYHEIKQGLSGTGGTASVVEYEVELVMCSECTEIVEYESNYCPNCGAKMDGDSK